jgi:hypothetical protein
MKKTLTVSFAFLFLLVANSCSKKENLSSGSNTLYYINSVLGNDSNNGTSQNTAWKSLSKINDIVLKPGDSVLLANNVVFEQPLLLNNILGSAQKKIVFTSYSPNNTFIKERATIKTENVLNAICINDCSFIELKNITVSARPGINKNLRSVKPQRCGILVQPTKNGVIENIIFDNIMVQDVFYETSGYKRPITEVTSANGTQSYGWGIRFINRTKEAIIKDIFIKNCQINNVSHTGIKFTGKNHNIKNIVIENCKILETGGPGIQMSGVDQGHIVNNYINKSGSANDSRKWGRGSGLWTWGSKDILIEKNYFLNANGPGDSAGAHIDFNCKNIILQYNFSAYNAGGFCEILGNNYNCAYRYNISVNDGHRVKGTNGAFQEGKTLWLSGFAGKNIQRNGPFNSYIYNNSIFVSKNVVSKFAFDKGSDGILIMNNIFYIQGESKGVLGDQYKPDTSGESQIKNVVFKNNLFLNADNWPNNIPIKDTMPLFGSPEFINVGGLNLKDYITKNTELIKDKGVKIERIPNDANGLILGLKVTHDILGQQIIDNPDMGAIEQKNED